MQFTLTVTRVRQIGGKVYVRFSDKVEVEFNSLQQARDYAAELDKSILRKLAISRYLQVDPNGTNPNLIEGHSITFSNEQNNMVVVT